MDKDKEETMKIISKEIDTRFQVNTINDIIYHNLFALNAPTTYSHLHIREFILLYRIECLYDNGLITQKVRKDLLELFDIFEQLNKKLEDLLIREKQYDIELEYMQIENDANKKVSTIRDTINQVTEQIVKIENIFKNYHLQDEIDLHDVISNSVSVDNNNYNYKNELENLRGYVK